MKNETPFVFGGNAEEIWFPSQELYFKPLSPSGSFAVEVIACFHVEMDGGIN